MIAVSTIPFFDFWEMLCSALHLPDFCAPYPKPPSVQNGLFSGQLRKSVISTFFGRSAMTVLSVLTRRITSICFLPVHNYAVKEEQKSAFRFEKGPILDTECWRMRSTVPRQRHVGICKK